MPAKAKSTNLPSRLREEKFWRLKFGIEASARYHEARRARLESYVSLVKIFSIIGAVLSLIFISGTYPDIDYFNSEIVVGILAAAIAIVNLIDLAFGVDGRARLHTDLYRRFKTLQESIARAGDRWDGHLDNWEADAQAIRIDEPPVFYALYLEFWNLAVEKFGADRSNMRKISKWQRKLRHFRRYQPNDFLPIDT